MPDGVHIAILAAGASRRLGQPKQFVNVNGEPLIRRQCRVALESRIGAVALICGHHADACIAAIADLPIAIERNEQWQEGIASSIRWATRSAIERDAAALLILHGDQYRITAEDLLALHAAWVDAGPAAACRARDGDYTGPPVILPAALYDTLMQLGGDQGARSVLAAFDASALIDVTLPNAAHDLDLPAQLWAVGQARG